MNKVKNLQQYILRYTVANLTSLFNIVSHWLIPSFTLLKVFPLSAIKYTLKDDNDNVKKCIRMGINILKIVILEGMDDV